VSKYPSLDDKRYLRKGWFSPVMRNFKSACCDCGLVHRTTFKIISYGRRRKIVFKMSRDNRATAAIRREKKKREAKQIERQIS
jgi:hypothetical protein